MIGRVLLLNSIVVLLGSLVFFLLIRARELKTYWPMLAMAMWQAPPYFVLMYVRHLGTGKITAVHAYHLYFETYWTCFAVASLFSMLLTYTIFHAAMRPLKGLQSLGNIMFTWAAAISLATAISAAVAPAGTGIDQAISAISQFQRSSAILIISLTLFVALSIRPMGLSWKTRIFGASLGTMIVSGTSMLQASYIVKTQGLFSIYNIIELVSSGLTLCIWSYYFAFPEPKRKFILLPTTSPFHQWNKVSQMLGQDPGVVAIGGIAPDVIAKAELEVFRRATLKMKESDERQTREALASSSSAVGETQLTKN